MTTTNLVVVVALLLSSVHTLRLSSFSSQRRLSSSHYSPPIVDSSTRLYLAKKGLKFFSDEQTDSDVPSEYQDSEAEERGLLDSESGEYASHRDKKYSFEMRVFKVPVRIND
jgi:hypothetical protein